jgi:hypothetical protein
MSDGHATGGEADLARIAKPTPLVRAMGGALTVLATLMARAGIAPLEETADLFGIYAVLTDEIDPDEGLILGFWASMLRDAADGMHGEATDQEGR